MLNCILGHALRRACIDGIGKQVVGFGGIDCRVRCSINDAIGLEFL